MAPLFKNWQCGMFISLVPGAGFKNTSCHHVELSGPDPCLRACKLNCQRADNKFMLSCTLCLMQFHPISFTFVRICWALFYPTTVFLWRWW